MVFFRGLRTRLRTNEIRHPYGSRNKGEESTVNSYASSLDVAGSNYIVLDATQCALNTLKTCMTPLSIGPLLPPIDTHTLGITTKVDQQRT